ncbi:MAG: hypothetical protein IKO46_01170 [Salinivirgaceae bacterium]|nr:hypothetical protein [Salinivirgaceae bacterium]MBR6081295.1 hypothetical protein [Salinivirgaceae bacterium]
MKKTFLPLLAAFSLVSCTIETPYDNDTDYGNETYIEELTLKYENGQTFSYYSPETGTTIHLTDSIECTRREGMLKNRFWDDYSITFYKSDSEYFRIEQNTGRIDMSYHKDNYIIIYDYETVKYVPINDSNYYVYVLNWYRRYDTDDYVFPETIYYSLEYGILKMFYSDSTTYTLTGVQ